MENEERSAEELYGEEESSDFGYMNDLLKAYHETLAEKKAKESALTSERKERVGESQKEIRSICKELLTRGAEAERKELVLTAKESAEECLGALSIDLEEKENRYARYATSKLLSRCVLLCNRDLNLLIRHGIKSSRLIFLILSELSAFFSIAAIK